MTQDKTEAIKKVQNNDKDTGSTEVQISILSTKITNLLGHLKTNKKDLHSNRGLLQMVADRRKLVKYLKKKDFASWDKLADTLKLKK